MKRCILLLNIIIILTLLLFSISSPVIFLHSINKNYDPPQHYNFISYHENEDDEKKEENKETRADSDYDFTIKCDDNSHITNGGDPTGYFINIKNTGTALDTIVLDWEIINVTGGTEPDPQEWSAFLNKEQVTLNPGDNQVVILNVSTFCGCQLDTTATIRVTGRSVNEPAVTGFVDIYTTRGPEEGAVELEKPNMSLFSDLEAGQDLDFTLKVVNLNPNQQSFKIVNPSKPQDWVVEFNENSFKVSAFSTFDFPVFTKIPEKIVPGNVMFVFKVQSLYDPYIKDSLDFTFALLPELAVKNIKLMDTEAVVGNKLKLQVTISNLGPALASSFIFEVYEAADLSSVHLITQINVDMLWGSEELVRNISWTPVEARLYNITVLVNPGFTIEEVGNRYGNNLKTTGFTILSETSNGNDNGNGSNGGPQGILIFSIFVVIVVLVLLYFIFQRQRANDESEKTAKKIPLKRNLGKKKTAKKLKFGDSRTGRKQLEQTRTKDRGKTRRRNDKRSRLR